MGQLYNFYNNFYVGYNSGTERDMDGNCTWEFTYRRNYLVWGSWQNSVGLRRKSSEVVPNYNTGKILRRQKAMHVIV